MNSGGLFLTPVANDLNVNMGVLTIYFSISSLVLMLALPILGRFIGKINIKTLIIASVILQGGIFAFQCMGILYIIHSNGNWNRNSVSYSGTCYCKQLV